MDSSLRQQVDPAVTGPRYAQWLAVGYLAVVALCTLVVYAEFRQIDRQVETLARERGNVLFLSLIHI